MRARRAAPVVSMSMRALIGIVQALVTPLESDDVVHLRHEFVPGDAVGP